MNLNEAELRIAVNALHVAAAQYAADAHVVDDGSVGGDRLKAAFEAQAKEATALAERITAQIG